MDRSIIDTIKERINCIDYAKMVGLDVQKNRTYSLDKGVSKTALSVKEQYFYDLN